MGKQKKIRFSQMREKFPKITPSSLSSILKELENQKIIEKNVFLKIPTRIEYSLSSSGKELLEVLTPLIDWAKDKEPIISEQNMEKARVAKAIEKVLLEMGKMELEKVKSRLKKEYKCILLDCYENPEFLKQILKDLFGKCYKDILAKIDKRLSDNEQSQSIRNFLRFMEE